MSRFFQYMAVLNPYRRVLTRTVQSHPIILGCAFPLPLVARLIGKSDDTRLRTFPAKSRHQTTSVTMFPSTSRERRARQICPKKPRSRNGCGAPTISVPQRSHHGSAYLPCNSKLAVQRLDLRLQRVVCRLAIPQTLLCLGDLIKQERVIAP